MPKRVLIVEDESKTAAVLTSALEEAGYAVSTLADGAQALEAIIRQPYDVVILDIMLPGLDGLAVLRQLRARGQSVPVLMLSARGELPERVDGLEAGADDYLAKPFGIAEVLARVKALTRRGGESKAVLLQVADLEMDVSDRTVRRAGQKLFLAPQEFRVLESLMRHSPAVCSRSTLLREAWDYNFDPGTNIVEVYIRRVRDKIDDGFTPVLLHTVKGMGYLLGPQI
jgi:two-component system, OmpR family, response regulator